MSGRENAGSPEERKPTTAMIALIILRVNIKIKGRHSLPFIRTKYHLPYCLAIAVTMPDFWGKAGSLRVMESNLQTAPSG